MVDFHTHALQPACGGTGLDVPRRKGLWDKPDSAIGIGERKGMTSGQEGESGMPQPPLKFILLLFQHNIFIDSHIMHIDHNHFPIFSCLPSPL